MEELIFDGKVYLSTKRAGEITGYAKDYVGQLARGGKVDARLVGRNWYVHKESVLAHKKGGVGTDSDLSYTATAPEEVKKPWEVTWGAPQYTPETTAIEDEVVPALLSSERKEDEGVEEIPDTHKVLEDMQSAWQLWNERSVVPTINDHEVEPHVESTPHESEEVVEEEMETEELTVPITVLAPKKEQERAVPVIPAVTLPQIREKRSVGLVQRPKEQYPVAYRKSFLPALHMAVLAFSIIASGGLLYIIGGGEVGTLKERSFVGAAVEYLSGTHSFERD